MGYLTVEALIEEASWSPDAQYAVDEKLVLLHREHAEEQEIHLTPAGEEFLHAWRWRWWRWVVIGAGVILGCDTLWSLYDRIAALFGC